MYVYLSGNTGIKQYTLMSVVYPCFHLGGEHNNYRNFPYFSVDSDYNISERAEFVLIHLHHGKGKKRK
jgi:hypothetical protein